MKQPEGRRRWPIGRRLGVPVAGILLLVLTSACLPRLVRQAPSVLAGSVLGERGEPVAGAELTFRDPQSGQQRLIGAGTDGRFELAFWLDAHGERLPLKPGQRLELLIYKPGYQLRTLQLVVPGGNLELGALVVQVEAQELLLEGLEREAPLPVEQELSGTTGRSGRGE